MSTAAPATPAPTVTGGTSQKLFLTASILSGISAATLIVNLIYTAVNVGSSDSWSTIKSKLIGILVTSLIGGIIFTIGLTLLIIARPSLSSWLPAAVSALALSVAVAGVSVAAISR